MHLRSLSGAVLALSLALPAIHAAPSPYDVDRMQWNAPQKPFRIYGNTWYVGPHGLSSILVDTGQGLALFDGDLPESATQIAARIRELGFQVRDVKWILNSHAHVDHAGGIAALRAASGAQVLASAAGARELELGGADRADPQYGSAPEYAPLWNVRVVRDGETLQLGHVAITAHYTPGHTPGGTSWTWDSCSGRRCLHIAYADSLSAISAPAYRFIDHPAYVAAFRKTIATVAALPCDILLTPHPDASGFWGKVAGRKSPTDVTSLIDANACRNYAAEAGKNLDERLANERAAVK
ncbi:subclass B3 metallo-beta-lactamase [Rhodanobacter aciditrophus]|uniref:subclass B3 metallo-beta-lactamase n=1 Tax=Rhodanobacter aciditrophus TaxID=1623218 RepID=UPI003CF487A1